MAEERSGNNTENTFEFLDSILFRHSPPRSYCYPQPPKLVFLLRRLKQIPEDSPAPKACAVVAKAEVKYGVLQAILLACDVSSEMALPSALARW